MQAKDCPKCKRAFGCQMADISDCQCSKIKIFASLSQWLTQHYDDCLCSNCLRDLAEVDRFAQLVPFPEQSKDRVMKYHYYIDEGRYVFTELYHYQKNYCCGNRCRHCVYGNHS